MTEVTPDWRPARRVVDPYAGFDKIGREQKCRACGLVSTHVKEGGALTKAHIVPRGQRGDDVHENLIPLCGSGNTGCHGCFDGQSNIATAPSLLAGEPRGFVCRRIALYGEEIAYALNKKGIEWLSKRFAWPQPTTP